VTGGDDRRRGDEPDDQSGWVTDPVRVRARTVPERTALVDAASDRVWSYREFDRAVGRTAARLRALGVGEGDHLGLAFGRRPATPRLLFAAVRVGAVAVALDPAAPPADLADRLSRADVTAVVADADSEEGVLAAAATAGQGGEETTARDAGVPVATVDDPVAGARELAAADAGTDAADARAGAGAGAVGSEPVRRGLAEPHLLVYTSGTTGAPKPVVLTAENLLASAVGSAFRLGVDPDDRWLCALPTHHVGGLAPMVRSAVYGTTAVLARPTDDGPRAGFDADRVLADLRERSVTAVSLVPTQLRRLLAAGEVPDLRFVLLGGSAAPPALVERALDRGVPVCPTYGATETASQVATARPAEARAHPDGVGRPLAVTGVTVVGDDGRSRDPGEVGELVVDGPTVTPGYYGAPGATALDGGYHTGDLAHRDADGRLFVHGRADDLITTGGETVAPERVRSALCEVEGVVDAAVVGLPDPEWGERVGALVAVDDAVGPAPEDLRAAVGDRLPPEAVPKTVAVAGALPRTASGTVDRGAVRDRLSATR
jgi:O-succinylbenzoic acid--CoA ligase